MERIHVVGRAGAFELEVSKAYIYLFIFPLFYLFAFKLP